MSSGKLRVAFQSVLEKLLIIVSEMLIGIVRFAMRSTPFLQCFYEACNMVNEFG